MIKAWIDNCGKLIYFGTYNGNQFPAVTKINNNPTIGVNGNTVPTSSGFFLNNSQNTPWTAFQPFCGFVESLGLKDAGYNVINPSLSCDGLTFGPPIITTGITHYIIHDSGQAFASTPSLWVAYLQTQPVLTTVSGYVSSIKPKANNILGRSQITPGSPVTISIGVGQGCILSPQVYNGQITGILIPGSWGVNNGSNYPVTVSLNIWDQTGTGASGILTVVNGMPYGVKMTSLGQNYTNPVITLAPSGNSVSIEAVNEPYLQYIPIVSSTYFYNKPVITSSHGIVLDPVMTGPLASDVVTYSAPANWLTASNLSIPAVANVPVDNWVGQKEASTPFDIPSFTGQIRVGVNYGEQPIYPGLANNPLKNKYYGSNGWTATGGNTITYDASGNPLSWTNPYSIGISRWLYGPNITNGVDNKMPPNQIGPYCLQYNDPFVNTASGSHVQLGGNGNNVNVDILNLSGPNKGTYNGIVIDPRDITYKNGQVYLTNQYSILGSGYEAALITVSGADGRQLSFVPVINSGIINTFQRVQIGQGYNYKPTIKVYGLGCQGNTVSGIFNYSYLTNRNTREIDVTLNVSQLNGSYYLNNVNVTSPDPYTGQVQPPDSNRLSPDISIVKSLSGVDCVRFMDVTGGYGGPNNFVTADDLINSAWDTWNIDRGTTATFQFCRAVNTDPSNTGYAWFTDRIYGTQDIFCDGEDSFGRYKLLPPNDMGNFVNSYSSWSCFVYQLRSLQPHGLKSGKYALVSTNTNKNSVPVTNSVNVSPNPLYSLVWVSDPYTVILSSYILDRIKSGTPQTDPPQKINTNQEINLVVSGVSPGWVVTTLLPTCKSSAPFDFTTKTTQDLNCANWVNFPLSYDSGLINSMGVQLKGSPEIYAEFGNEIWSGGDLQSIEQVWNNLLGYLPSGTPFGDYFVSNGHRPQFGVYGASLLMSGRAFDLLQKITGLPDDKFHRIIGSFYAQYYITGLIVENAAWFDSNVDGIAIAPYYTIPGDSNIVNAMTPVGVSNGVGLPPDAINSLVKNYMLYNTYDAQIWAGHINKINNFQQPVNGLNIAIASTSGSTLPAANYTAYCTFSDAAGLETTVGLSKSMYIGIHSGSVLGINTCAVPKWASKLNIYLSNNPPDTPILFQSFDKNTIFPGQFVTLNTSWPTQKIYPPTVNYASGYIEKEIELVTYEGGIDHVVPDAVPFNNIIAHDTYADDSYGNTIEAWYRNCAYRGATLANYYQAYGFPYRWFESPSTAQIAGDTSNNQYAIGRYPADRSDHTDVNKSAGLNGLRRAIAAVPKASPIVIPPTPSGTSILHHVWRSVLMNYFGR